MIGQTIGMCLAMGLIALFHVINNQLVGTVENYQTMLLSSIFTVTCMHMFKD